MEREAAAAREQGLDDYELINRKAMEIPPGSDGLIFLPYLTGERSTTESQCGKSRRRSRLWILRRSWRVLPNLNRSSTRRERQGKCEMRPKLVLGGVIPANLLPFMADLEIDEKNYRRHIRYIVDTQGVRGLTTNGHAAEVATLSFDEQQRSLNITVDEVSGKLPVICGVYADGTRNAVTIAKMAEREGADCLLVFPSAVYGYGSHLRPEMAYSHIATIAAATSLPIIVFVYPVISGLHIKTDNVVRICMEIDNVIAIKEWSNDITVYEMNYRELKGLSKNISVLTSFSKALLPSLCIGADGILSGHGSVIADFQVALFDAVQNNDLRKARLIAEKIYPLVQVFYKEPFLDMHNRMKEANAMLGRIDAAYVRPPLQPITAAEREMIRSVLAEAGIIK
ncbi:MAG: dihydrodipicolinate synthase family protein [Desulfitobacteriaceae bacterium]